MSNSRANNSQQLKFRSLDDWLAWQTTLHAREIELGLDRITEVAKRMGLLRCPFKVITVAGTNGKGSTVAMLTSILHHAGYRVGTYTSPHIVHYNERISVGQRCVTDAKLCASFAKIDAARSEISLSFFEFATLTALDIFHKEQVDVAVLEVGLGGRLDATNMIDSDLGIVTSIGLDHTEYLGPDRESIGFEKAGIFRSKTPAICGDPLPPASVAATAEKMGAHFVSLNQDYSYSVEKSSWSFNSAHYELQGLPLPNLSGAVQLQNASTALMGLHLISAQLPVNLEAIKTGLREVTLEGRFQRIVKECEVILDVAHNYDSAEVLANNLVALPKPEKTIAVFAILSDKDLTGIVQLLHGHVDEWYVSSVDSPRAMPIERVSAALHEAAADTRVRSFNTVEQAYEQAQQDVSKGDRILVFGSIFTVSEVIASGK